MYKYLLLLLIITSSCLVAQDNTRLDDDNDMIMNEYDQCPNTPEGVCVDENGCTKIIKRVVNFDKSSYKISNNAGKSLQEIVEIAQECYGYNLVINGHTDSTYTEQFNKSLSHQRAKSIKNIFLLHGINYNRIKINWYGETKPIATNVTKEGRFDNRRVEIIFK